MGSGETNEAANEAVNRALETHQPIEMNQPFEISRSFEMNRPFEISRSDYLPRPRLCALLAKAVAKPLALVCAGAGYGKTHAVLEFASQVAGSVAWLHFTGCDNAGSRFWAKYIQAIQGWDPRFVAHCREFGFPDTEDKINRHLALRQRFAPDGQQVVVLDDLHLLEDPAILKFVGRGLRAPVGHTAVIIICRALPDMDLAGLRLRGMIPTITEAELSFTEHELDRYLAQQGVTVSGQSLRGILKDTKGLAFAINLVARSLKKAPGYEGYVQTAIKQNLFQLMKTEVFQAISEGLRRLLARLSLIDHLAADLVAELAYHDRGLLAELERQHAYVRFDSDINAYLIHQLFLDFLRAVTGRPTETGLLTEAQRRSTYLVAARWCVGNGFHSDALCYQEKVGDYAGIVKLLAALPVQMSEDVARLAAGIFARAPAGLSVQIDGFAVMHVRILIRLGHRREALAWMRQYEGQFARLPEGDGFRNRTMGAIYYSWGNVRALMGTMDGDYDFDIYYARMAECLDKAPVKPDQYANMPIGFWVSLAGSLKPGGPQEYIAAAARSVGHLARCWGGGARGVHPLCQGELLFYQGHGDKAEPLFTLALAQARDSGQFEIEAKALFYFLRLALWRGNQQKAEQALGEMAARLEEKRYSHRFINSDIAWAWYYCYLRRPGNIPAWLKEQFVPYRHAYFVENTGNQLKARYHYLTGNYAPVLAYIEELKQREAVLYGRVEMLALEACIHFHTKDQAAAFAALQSACEAARPNGLILPFAELGRDMRSLAAAAIRSAGGGLPLDWLEVVRRKAAAFAKAQSMVIANYDKAQGGRGRASLSSRERKILADLYHGLSRPEIAVKQALSLHTVNSAVTNLFNKLGAQTAVDAVRIAAEEKLV